MPWMFLNILKKVDIEMKASINLRINSGKLKNVPNKAFYTYLLIDIGKFHENKSFLNNKSLIPHEPSIEDFILFKSCIFYVGKGISNRKHKHLTLAKQLYCGVLPKRKV